MLSIRVASLNGTHDTENMRRRLIIVGSLVVMVAVLVLLLDPTTPGVSAPNGGKLTYSVDVVPLVVTPVLTFTLAPLFHPSQGLRASTTGLVHLPQCSPALLC